MIPTKHFALFHSSTLLAALALAAGTLTIRAADRVIDTFDTEEDAANWSATWNTTPVLSFDPQNAGGGAAGSGSLRVAADYFTPGGSEWEQMVITRTFDPPVEGAEYVSVSVDVKVDPESVPTTGGQYGYFEFKRTSDATAIGGVNLTSTDWTHITFNLAATEGSLAGIIVQNGNAGFQGPVTYYLDNLVFTGRSPTPDPPTLSIAPSTAPGLKLYASAPGQAYQRQNVVYAPSEDLANTLWWVNQSDPVSYAITWADFPDPATTAGFQGHLMLSTDTGMSNTPDWNDPNVILIEFQYANHPGPDGETGTTDDAVRARARFLHKVNEAAGNAMLYRTPANAGDGPVGVLGEVWAPSMLGTWTVTFRNNTELTLTASDNSSLDISLPAEEAAAYEPVVSGLSAQFGVQPNADTRIGLSAVASRFKIMKGTAVVVDETFQTAELDPAIWIIRAADAGGIFTAPPDLAYLVSWNLPDTGFSLRSGPSVTGPWTVGGDARLVGARRVVLVHQSALPGAGAGFYQLISAGAPQ